MLRKVTPLTQSTNDLNQVLMIAYKTVNPVEPSANKQCRFMLFIRLRPGIPSYFHDRKRTHYYRGDTFTDQEPIMLRNLLKLLDKHLVKFDRVELYDNLCNGEERIILKITDDTIDRNRIPEYSLMLTNYILPWFLNVKP